MVKIAICDDDPCYIKRLEHLLARFFHDVQHPCRVRSFSSGEKLLQDAHSFHILFLDINLPGLNGLDVAQLLRKRNPDFLLIFVSAHMEYAPLGYEVHAFRYLIKTQLESSFDGCMRAVVHALGLSRETISLPFVDGGSTIYIDEIVYVESQKHVAKFHLCVPHRELRIYKTLDYLADLLPAETFVRIHKSYLLNLHYLDNVLNYTAHLTNGRTLPISQSKFSNVKRKFIYYKGRI